LSNTDENIKNMLQEKFASHESTVNPEIWNSISNGLSSASTTTASSVSISKIIGIAAAAVAATVTMLIVLNSSRADGEIATNTPVDAKTEETSISQKSENSTIQNSQEINSSNQEEILPTTSISAIELPSTNDNTEDLAAGNWQDINDRNVGINDGLGNNKNDSDKKNVSNNIYNDTDEPVSASFHTKVVDVTTMRYFFFPKTSANATFKWTSSDGYSSSDITFSHEFIEEGNYTIELTATDKSGNVATESSTIQVVKPIVFKIPNAFSPGINGRNDVINFEEATQNESSINSVTVIDRNGDVIYESNNDFIWNGSNKSGELAPAGVYTYLIAAIDKLGESRMNKGTIQLFRE